MKEISELIQQGTVYLHDWAEDEGFALIADFEDVFITKKEYEAKECPTPNKPYWVEKKVKMEVALNKYKNINILFATYSNGNYSGDAWVLYEENGQLYEINASHCSCYGLEGQWDKELVVLEELKNRLENGTFGTDDYCGNEFAAELKLFLGVKP